MDKNFNKKKQTILILALSALSGVLYHLGGLGGVWWKNTKVRDLGVSLCTILCIILYNLYSKQLTIVLNLRTFVIFTAVFLTSWLALSSYWRWVNPKADGVKAINWFLHGTGCGLALLPLVFATDHPYNLLYKILLRSLVLGGIMMIVSEASENVFVEETGRGASILVSLPILF